MALQYVLDRVTPLRLEAVLREALVGVLSSVSAPAEPGPDQEACIETLVSRSCLAHTYCLATVLHWCSSRTPGSARWRDLGTPPAAPAHTPSSSLPVTPIPTPLPGRPPRSQPAQGERTLRALDLRSFSVGGAPPQLLAAQAYDLGPMAMAFDFDVRWPSEMVAGCPPRSSLGGTSAAPRMPLGCRSPSS